MNLTLVAQLAAIVTLVVGLYKMVRQKRWAQVENRGATIASSVLLCIISQINLLPELKANAYVVYALSGLFLAASGSIVYNATKAVKEKVNGSTEKPSPA